MINTNDDINEKLLALCPEGVALYLVGGYIRDSLLNRECFDRDYVVVGQSAADFAKKVADALKAHFVMLDKEHDIARVVMPDKKNTLDFAVCVGKNINTDLANRDYTINAVACLVERNNCAMIDPFHGQKDINARIIRAISEENLINDPLRLLRAFRHAAQFGFAIEKKTLELIKKHHKLINNVAFERINTELIKLFEADNTAENLVLMKEAGILFEIFPDLTPQKDVPPNLHHHLCLIDHSIEVVKQLEIEVKEFPEWAKSHINREFATNIRTISLLKTAALLHDTGKPATWTIDETGRHRFIKHDEVGAEQVVELLKRLKFSKNAICYITTLIRHHLYPSQLIREGLDVISDKAIMRFFRKINDKTPDLLLLALCDRLSARGPEITEETVEKNIKGTYTLLEKYEAAGQDAKTVPKLANGRDVMELLGIPRCPKVGEVLSALKEVQISGDINTRDEALEFIKNFKS